MMKALMIHWCLLAIGGLSVAQLIDLPSCAKQCATTLPKECGIEVKCICANVGWITGISCCIKTTCSDEDQQRTIKLATDLCKIANVQLPQAASCAASAGSTSTSSAQSSSSSSSSSSSAASGSTTTSKSNATASSATDVSSPSDSPTGTSTGSSVLPASASSSLAASATSTAAAVFNRPGMAVAGVAVAALALI